MCQDFLVWAVQDALEFEGFKEPASVTSIPKYQHSRNRKHSGINCVWCQSLALTIVRMRGVRMARLALSR